MKELSVRIGEQQVWVLLNVFLREQLEEGHRAVEVGESDHVYSDWSTITRASFPEKMRDAFDRLVLRGYISDPIDDCDGSVMVSFDGRECLRELLEQGRIQISVKVRGK